MADTTTVEAILEQIHDPAIRLVAQTALNQSRKAMEFSDRSRITFVADEIGKIIPKALKQRVTNAAEED